MKYLKTLKKTIATWVYKKLTGHAPRTFKTLAVEERSVAHLPLNQQEAAIIMLRFEAWRAHFDISTGDKAQLRKMRLAFRAGFFSRELSRD